MRTTPAHRKAVRAPVQDQVASPPSSAGAGQANKCPYREEGVDPDDGGVGKKVRGVPLGISRFVGEQPADVRPQETFGHGSAAGTEPPWRMRVPSSVGMGVVAASGHPLDHRTLYGHAAGDGKGDAESPAGAERTMGEVPMKSGGHPVPGHRVEQHREPGIEPGRTSARCDDQRQPGCERQQRPDQDQPEQCQLRSVRNRRRCLRRGLANRQTGLNRSLVRQGGCIAAWGNERKSHSKVRLDEVSRTSEQATGSRD